MPMKLYTFHVEPEKITALKQTGSTLFELPVDISKQIRAALNVYLSLPDEKKREWVKKELLSDSVCSVQS